MVSQSLVDEQLKRAGCNFNFWGRAEVRELPNILMDDEIIQHCLNGRYQGGFATLCATNHRLLLIDRKLMFLSVEDIRFDMIAELDYTSQFIDGTIHVVTPNRSLRFVSWHQAQLRRLLGYVQERVMQARQQYLPQQFQQQSRSPIMAGLVGGMALQGNNTPTTQVLNPYTRVPLLSRKRNYPRFY
ncbi:MAG TPA: PH domain-containing protein [Candidatus Saccharimonadales bacterium]|nr:PH domain-containing protein [Candidatus Saccharimonadales bacterium]